MAKESSYKWKIFLSISIEKCKICEKLVLTFNFFPNPYVNRDAIIYGASCFTSGLPTVMKVLSEGVLQPRLTDQEVMIIDYYTQRTVEFDYYYLDV